MSKMQYNVFVSSDVPDAAMPYEVDVDTTRDAFEKTGTLSYYASSSTTISPHLTPPSRHPPDILLPHLSPPSRRPLVMPSSHHPLDMLS